MYETLFSDALLVSLSAYYSTNNAAADSSLTHFLTALTMVCLSVKKVIFSSDSSSPKLNLAGSFGQTLPFKWNSAH